MITKTFVLGILLSLTIVSTFGQNESLIKLDTESGIIEGSLLIPAGFDKGPVTLIIAGSGPTDRNGNNIQMKNNSLKMLAEGLAGNGIASVRYDKRGVAKSLTAGMKEIDLRFDFYVDDARKWVDLLDEDERFSEIIIAGHSEGSLIGIIASQKENVDKFISLAGAGDAAGQILRRQLAAQPGNILEQSLPVIEKLEAGEEVDSIPPVLFTLFRPSVQPYIISWLKYNPQTEIVKLNKPVLLIQGTTDIQIEMEDFQKLLAAKPDSHKAIIEGMNHVLKEAPADRNEQMKTYFQPDFPLKEGLISAMVEFINKQNKD